MWSRNRKKFNEYFRFYCWIFLLRIKEKSYDPYVYIKSNFLSSENSNLSFTSCYEKRIVWQISSVKTNFQSVIRHGIQLPTKKLKAYCLEFIQFSSSPNIYKIHFSNKIHTNTIYTLHSIPWYANYREDVGYYTAKLCMYLSDLKIRLGFKVCWTKTKRTM